MGKYCLPKRTFESKVAEIIDHITDVQADIESNKRILFKFQNELKNLVLKDGCNECLHKVECVTNEPEGIN